MASPSLLDPNFARAVVLLVEHDDEGTMGVVLNRPTEHQAAASLPFADAIVAPASVFAGGPVQPDHGLAVADGEGPFTVEVAVTDGRLGLVAPDTESVDRVRFFVGYAGWSPGQLDTELVEQAWWVVDAYAADVFSGQPGDLWRAVLRRQGGPLALMASFPDDVSLN